MRRRNQYIAFSAVLTAFVLVCLLADPQQLIKTLVKLWQSGLILVTNKQPIQNLVFCRAYSQLTLLMKYRAIRF